MSDLRVWVRASTIRRGRYWLPAGGDDGQPPGWAEEVLASLDAGRPSAAWIRASDGCGVAAAGFSSAQTQTLGRPLWSLVAVTPDATLAARLGAGLILATADPAASEITATIGDRVLDADPSAFRLAPDLVEAMERVARSFAPQLAPDDLVAAPDELPSVGALDHRTAATMSYLLATEGLPPEVEICAATPLTGVTALLERRAWVLTADGTASENPFAAPVSRRRSGSLLADLREQVKAALQHERRRRPDSSGSG